MRNKGSPDFHTHSLRLITLNVATRRKDKEGFLDKFALGIQ